MSAKSIYNSNEFIGKTYHRLTAIKYLPNFKNNQYKYWLFKCLCGKDHVTILSEVVRGRIKSCGCLQIDNFNKIRRNTYVHGMFRSREYSSWQHMKARCNQKNGRRYKNYGGRGISVCEEWNNSFENFFKDMGPMPENCNSIERLDVNGNYCKDNCIWENEINQRINKSNTIFVIYNEKKITLVELCKIKKIPYSTTKQRLKLGWNIDKAISTPIRKINS